MNCDNFDEVDTNSKKSIDDVDEKSIDDVGVRTSAASEKSVIPFINIVCSDETIPVGGCTFVPFVGEKLMHGAATTKILLIL